MRARLLKLGTVKHGRAQHGGSNRRAWTGLPQLTGKSEQRGLGDRFRGSAWDELPLPIVPLLASLVGSLRV